jgi:hypothetical protein
MQERTSRQNFKDSQHVKIWRGGGVWSLKTYFEFLSSEATVVDNSVPPLVAIAGRQ